MKIGLLCGSFNPVHNGHMIIANYMAEFTDIEQVWMIVSPHNPLKPAGELLNDYQRLKMVELAIGNYKKIKSSDVEFTLSKPSYTINTLNHLKEKFPQHDFCLIMGSDNLDTLHKWKNYEMILADYEIYIYPRPASDGGQFKNHPGIKFVDAPMMEISATFIRNAIKEKKNMQFFINITAMLFYRI